MFVMGSGLTIATLLNPKLFLKMTKPWLAKNFNMPTSRMLDKKLIVGASMFGVGWGLTGICPGPGYLMLTAQNEQSAPAWIWLLGMLIGMRFHVNIAKFL